ncbi:pitrilysin family protein [Inquilinus sp. Marseille-Q2685]|uniref:M16 family metallopeptidase n=1 Tax=Inquilinus sp. Marseille-Q2685 TaxID=2866581 RepID=UPI001CE43842|nr:pitrilysin family protein [Inquilinus sp. Marseille-Q2685]
MPLSVRRLAAAFVLSAAVAAPSLAQEAAPPPAVPPPASPTGAPPLAAPAPLPDDLRIAPQAQSFTLGNGLQFIVIPAGTAPVVTQMVWYRVGAADEAPGQSGIAHFLEHLMFHGTTSKPQGYSQELAAIGGVENAFTTADYTAYYQSVAKQNLPLVMRYEADRMQNLVLEEKRVNAERDVVLEERRMRIENEPSSRLGEAMNAVLYLNHPYRAPVIGWPSEIEALNRETALAFYDRFYTPNNATVVIAGDVDPAAVKAQAEEIYGPVKRRAEPPPRVRPQEPQPPAPRRLELTDARAGQPYLRRNYLAPSVVTAAPGEAAALQVLAAVLSGETGRLYRALVSGQGETQSLAAMAGAGYDPDALDYSPFAVYAVPRGDVALPDLEAAMDVVLASVRDEAVPEEELARAKRRLLAGAIYGQDDPGALARVFGEAAALGRSVADVQGWPGRIAAVTAADVQKAAQTYLQPPRSVTGLLTRPADATQAKQP